MILVWCSLLFLAGDHLVRNSFFSNYPLGSSDIIRVPATDFWGSFIVGTQIFHLTRKKIGLPTLWRIALWGVAWGEVFEELFLAL